MNSNSTNPRPGNNNGLRGRSVRPNRNNLPAQTGQNREPTTASRELVPARRIRADGSLEARVNGSATVNNGSYTYTYSTANGNRGNNNRENNRADGTADSYRYDYYRDYQSQPSPSDYGDGGNDGFGGSGGGGGGGGGNRGRNNSQGGNSSNGSGNNDDKNANSRQFQHSVHFSFSLGPGFGVQAGPAGINVGGSEYRNGGLFGTPVGAPLFGAGFPFAGRSGVGPRGLFNVGTPSFGLF